MPDTTDDVATNSTDQQTVLRELDADDGAERKLIFVSYRVNPDQSVAAALKRLIESALEPPPEVFVSGEGGLRPSEIGYKPQLQKAVQRAVAFIGVITHASKEREWIYYEAGAAWGRGQMYAPLLIDTSPGDLSSSIADYQAIRAGNRDEMGRLLADLAAASGAKVKPHLNNRLQAFQRAIGAYKKSQSGAEQVEDEESDLFSRAIALSYAGQRDEAHELFGTLEEQATTVEEKASICLTKLLAGKYQGAELLESFESVPPEYKDTAAYHHCAGIVETSPLRSMRHLERCVEMWDTAPKRAHDALVMLARREHASGMVIKSRNTLLRGLRESDRRLRAASAEAWCELYEDLSPLQRLMMLFVGIRSFPSGKLYSTAIELAMQEGWTTLAVHYGRALDELLDDGVSANTLGRAYAHASLYSMAFVAYTKAAKSGVSVGTCNIAHLFGFTTVPAAGLKYLDEHLGAFDAADPDYPYQTRAGLERAVHEERQKADRLARNGRQLAVLLGNFAEQAVPSETTFVPQQGTRFVYEGTKYTVSSTGVSEFLATTDVQQDAMLFVSAASVPFWTSARGGATLVLRSTANGRVLSGVRFDAAADDTQPEPVEIELIAPDL
ncbi:hypothetical protein [Sorangium sp. So ce1099]|uniref:hypothetical protein n=1 Tax=Sorangium sp. So ce1099 TaxID=3133331 RepID=UPI003F5DF2B4